MMSGKEAPDVIFAEVEYAIKKLQEDQPAHALNALLRVRSTIAAHALKHTNADVGSIFWYEIIDVLRAEFPQGEDGE
jgi:hypothetical protein